MKNPKLGVNVSVKYFVSKKKIYFGKFCFLLLVYISTNNPEKPEKISVNLSVKYWVYQIKY